MATYYRWRQSENAWIESQSILSDGQFITGNGTAGNGVLYYSYPNGSIKPTFSNGVYSFSVTTASDQAERNQGAIDLVRWFMDSRATSDHCYYGKVRYSNYNWYAYGNVTKYTSAHGPGAFIGYVYSTNASAYPNGGVQGDYYYDQRTTITSPTAPSGLSYPNPITTPTVTVSWTAATSNVPSYGVSLYEVSYATNGGSNWSVVDTTASTSMSVPLPAGITSVQFRVRTQDSNGQWSGYLTGTASTVLLAPTLTVPSLAMQGQSITVNWTSVDTATSYTLQRKADTDTDWVDVYSGPDLTFTETVGSWTSVQYQVQAVFSSSAGGWATSGSIPVISASALVISGTDEDLGTLTADVAYTVSSDTGNPITLTRTVNGNLVATLTVQSGFAYTISVMDLPTGSGTIEISATVNTTSGGPVSATRTWTYQKTAITFPNGASVGQLNQNGANVFPATLAEAVKVPANWGGTLDKALELLYDAANSAVISVGTYEGSGTFGADNPNALTISPAPQVVTIYGGGQTLVISSTDTSSPAYINGTTVKWYSTVSAADQMNTDGVTYSYVAVAKGVTT